MRPFNLKPAAALFNGAIFTRGLKRVGEQHGGFFFFLFDIAWVFSQCSGNWLVNSSSSAGPIRAQQPLELSAIRAPAQESFNTEQREGAERSWQPFSFKKKQDSVAYMGFLCSKKGSYTFLTSHWTMIKL